MAKAPISSSSGSDSPQRQDYKKTSAPKPGSAKKQNLTSYGKMGKGLNSNALNIFQMGKK